MIHTASCDIGVTHRLTEFCPRCEAMTVYDCDAKVRAQIGLPDDVWNALPAHVRGAVGTTRAIAVQRMHETAKR